MSATRYTAKGRKAAEAARAARLEARNARLGALPFDEFLAEWSSNYAIVTTDEDVAAARRTWLEFRTLTTATA